MNLNIENRIYAFTKIIEKTLITNEGNVIKLNDGLDLFFDFLFSVKKNKGNLFIIGNGGSAGVASHAATDFFNVAKLKVFTLHESSLITCFSNDYGYEHVFAKQINQLMQKKDMLIAISSSGNSSNIRNAVDEAKKKQATVITLSGFKKNNPLRNMGNLNIWLDSCDYGFVEIGHQFLLHNIADRFNPIFK